MTDVNMGTKSAAEATAAAAATATGGTAAAAVAINLIPRGRQERAQVRRRLRRWGRIVPAYAGLLAVGLGFCFLRWGPVVRDLSGEVAKTNEQIDALRSARARTQAELTEARHRLDSAQALLGQPDWSTLMAILADTLGDEVVLEQAQLELVVDKAAVIAAAAQKAPGDKPLVAPPPPANKWVLRAGGYAKTPAAVSHFVLRLEGLDLFDRATLLKTNHEPFRSSEATSFQVECPIKGRGRAGR